MALIPTTIPRLRLGTFPTPLVHEVGLAEVLGTASVWVKRDDLTGFSWGGNKVRTAELLLGDAMARDAEVIVLSGGPSSNFAAVMAAAAATQGLDVVQVSYGDEPAVAPAALVVARQAGARVVFTGSEERSTMDAAAEAEAGRLRVAGRRTYLVPRGGATALGALGFADAAEELGEQVRAEHLGPITIVVPVGSGGSLAGLLAGLSTMHARGEPVVADVVGVSVSRSPGELATPLVAMAQACAHLLGCAGPTRAPMLVDARGAGFGVADPSSEALAERITHRSGLLVDPVYNAKALAWLAGASDVLAGRGRTIVYWHTGGALGVVDRGDAARRSAASNRRDITA